MGTYDQKGHNCKIHVQGWRPFKRRRLYRFYAGKWYNKKELEESDYFALLEFQRQTPIPLIKVEESKRQWWMFRDEFYWEDEGYSAEEMRALLLDRVEQREKKVKRVIYVLTKTTLLRHHHENLSPMTSRCLFGKETEADASNAIASKTLSSITSFRSPKEGATPLVTFNCFVRSAIVRKARTYSDLSVPRKDFATQQF